MYFDIYGSTQAIKLRGTMPVSRSHSPLPRTTSSTTSAPTRVALPPLPTMIRRESPAVPPARPAQPYEFSSNILRVLLRDEANGTTGAPIPNLLDDEDDENNSPRPQNRPTLPPRRPTDEPVLRRTVDDLLTDVPSVTVPRPPPIAPRPTPLLGPLPAPPSRPPPPTPTSIIGTLSTGGTSTSLHGASSALESLLSRQSGVAQDLPSSSRSSMPNLQSLSVPTATRAKSAQLSIGRESAERDEGQQGDEMDECTVCMSARVNSALYKCGHSCMCYDCAMQTYRSSGLCPLCRASIMDVIKIFKA
ncbi:zinc finger, C3HC4 type [Oesophagostomum dentatum]|uniref:Zinc finger, C3HC4 type n=1 Tax=Oesophagostomum dentatum TaxID=61180 RepID=A0A0B1TRU6_OESDE|nr:zinc finger, C3HC4 type [Oesophagostomum dentatum]